MKKKIIISLFAALAAAASLFLFYKPINMFAKKPAALKSGLCVKAKALTTGEQCEAALGKLSRNLLKSKKRKIYPVELSITNKKLHNVTLNLKKTNFNVASRKAIFCRIRRSNYKMLKILGLGAGIFLGCTVLGICTSLAILCNSTATINVVHPVGGTYTIGRCAVSGSTLYGLLFGSPILGTATGLIAAPTAMLIYGSRLSKKDNQKTQRLFGSKKLILEPGQTRTLYLFVQEKDYQENLELTFVDGNGKQETISCHCPLN